MPVKSQIFSLRRIVLMLWLSFFGPARFHDPPPVRSQSQVACSTCHRQLKGNQIVTIFQTSTHGRNGITRNRCHGGDPSQSDKAKTHADRFIGKPDTAGTLEVCGRCHHQPLEYHQSLAQATHSSAGFGEVAGNAHNLEWAA